MRMPLVSDFLPEITQQIHSLRAKGVISFHTARTFGSALTAFRKSAGRACTAPVAVFLFFMSCSHYTEPVGYTVKRAVDNEMK
jgi:hypothetical protein